MGLFLWNFVEMWVHFWDMNSGGRRKEKWKHIFIEAQLDEATSVFYSRFGHNPNRVTCTCCGEDYSISSYATLEEATAYHRGCKFDRAANKYVEESSGESWQPFVSLETFLTSDDVKVIREGEIKPEERDIDVPEQGYVWRN